MEPVLWYCVSEHCPRVCTVVTDIPEPILVRAGHCIEFLSPKIRGKAVWKRGISVEDSLKVKQ